MGPRCRQQRRAEADPPIGLAVTGTVQSVPCPSAVILLRGASGGGRPRIRQHGGGSRSSGDPRRRRRRSPGLPGPLSPRSRAARDRRLHHIHDGHRHDQIGRVGAIVDVAVGAGAIPLRSVPDARRQARSTANAPRRVHRHSREGRDARRPRRSARRCRHRDQPGARAAACRCDAAGRTGHPRSASRSPGAQSSSASVSVTFAFAARTALQAFSATQARTQALRGPVAEAWARPPRRCSVGVRGETSIRRPGRQQPYVGAVAGQYRRLPSFFYRVPGPCTVENSHGEQARRSAPAATAAPGHAGEENSITGNPFHGGGVCRSAGGPARPSRRRRPRTASGDGSRRRGGSGAGDPRRGRVEPRGERPGREVDVADAALHSRRNGPRPRRLDAAEELVWRTCCWCPSPRGRRASSQRPAARSEPTDRSVRPRNGRCRPRPGRQCPVPGLCRCRSGTRASAPRSRSLKQPADRVHHGRTAGAASTGRSAAPRRDPTRRGQTRYRSRRQVE